MTSHSFSFSFSCEQSSSLLSKITSSNINLFPTLTEQENSKDGLSQSPSSVLFFMYTSFPFWLLPLPTLLFANLHSFTFNIVSE
jgi:hypothetical protein